MRLVGLDQFLRDALYGRYLAHHMAAMSGAELDPYPMTNKDGLALSLAVLYGRLHGSREIDPVPIHDLMRAINAALDDADIK